MGLIRHRLLAGLLGLSVATGVPAADQDLLELMRVLKENGTITEAQYQRLASAMEKDPQPQRRPEPQPEAAEEPVDVLLRVDKGGIEASSFDGRFSFKLGGRIMADGAWHAEDRVDLGDGTELRRAWLEAEGVMFGDWGYELGVEFAGGVEIKDAYLEYLGWPERSLALGQFNMQFDRFDVA